MQNLQQQKTKQEINAHLRCTKHIVYYLLSVCSNKSIFKFHWTTNLRSKICSVCFWHTWDLETDQSHQTRSKFSHAHFKCLAYAVSKKLFFSLFFLSFFFTAFPLFQYYSSKLLYQPDMRVRPEVAEHNLHLNEIIINAHYSISLGHLHGFSLSILFKRPLHNFRNRSHRLRTEPHPIKRS